MDWVRGQTPSCVGMDWVRGQTSSCVGMDWVRGQTPSCVGMDWVRGQTPSCVGMDWVRGQTSSWTFHKTRGGKLRCVHQTIVRCGWCRLLQFSSLLHCLVTGLFIWYWDLGGFRGFANVSSFVCMRSSAMYTL